VLAVSKYISVSMINRYGVIRLRKYRRSYLITLAVFATQAHTKKSYRVINRFFHTNGAWNAGIPFLLHFVLKKLGIDSSEICFARKHPPPKKMFLIVKHNVG